MKHNKRLGQNFLSDKRILQKIIGAGELSPSDTVLEIGPGTGNLTKLLAEKAKKVIAVEKDPRLVEFLKVKFCDHKNIQIIHGDILKPTTYHLTPTTCYKIIANIPYYITSQFLKNSLTAIPKPKLMVLMVQYEVAKRITARPGEMNLLALSVQIFGKPKIIAKIPRHYFHPSPQVDSAIIKITDISDKRLKDNDMKEEKLFPFLKKAFGQKRKTLRKSLGIKNLPEKYSSARPEELSLEDWVVLARQFS